MITSNTPSRLGGCVPVLIAALMVGVTVRAAAADAYPETREVLTELVIAGHAAAMHYRLSAHQAGDEDLPHLADLFKAMAASQLVMVRNFERYLTELDGSVSACAHPRIDRSTTRRNLIAAIKNEIRETDELYPQALERIRPERHPAVMNMLRQAIEAQALRRRDMQAIDRGARHFYGLLKREIQRRATIYYICQKSGAMLMNALPAICPVRGASTESYRVLYRISTGRNLNACQPGNTPRYL